MNQAVKSANNFVSRNASRFGRGEFVAKIYPSGDFTIGRSQPIKSDRTYDPLSGISQDGFGIANASRSPKIEPDGLELWQIAQAYEKSGNAALAERFARCAGDALSDSSMGLSVASNSPKFKKNRGSTGITPQNKRLVKSACTIFEQKFGKENTMFGTATIPVLTPLLHRMVCEKWSAIVKHFMKEIQRKIERNGGDPTYIFVTEIQEERYTQYGVVAPHLHWICQSRIHAWAKWHMSPDFVAGLWLRVLSHHLGQPVSSKASTRIETVRCSIAKEMSKYLTKGGKLLKRICSDGHADLLPSAYMGMIRSLKREVVQAINVLTGDEALNFIDNLQGLARAGLLCFTPICLEYAGREIVVGWVGFLKEKSIQIALAA